MNKEYLKQVINPKDLAMKTLGQPITRKGNSIWYKSPFRVEERTASFEVTDKSFHDFGTGEHFDIISFVRRYRHCSFKEACKWLANLYGIADNEYDNERVQRFLEQQRLAMKNYREKIETWFISLMNLVEEVWDENEECIKAVGLDTTTLAILYDRQIFLGCLREEILETNTFEEKEKLRKQVTKEGLPVWMKSHKGYGLILAD